jgi:protein tyrosine/serine phosphatase
MKSRTRLLSAAVLVVMTVASTTQAAAGTKNGTRIENFGRINDGYYRGGQPQGSDYQDLAAMGIRTIIDLQEADGDPNEASLARAAGMTYYRIPMSTHRPPTSDQLALFFKLVGDPAAQPVYVHCKGGRHRTGVMTAAYRMSFDGWKADRAFAEMKQYDFGPDFLHPEFKRYVYSYDVRRVPAPVTAAVTQQ